MRFLNKEILSSFDCTLLYGLRGKTKKVVFLKKWLEFFLSWWSSFKQRLISTVRLVKWLGVHCFCERALMEWL